MKLEPRSIRTLALTLAVSVLLALGACTTTGQRPDPANLNTLVNPAARFPVTVTAPGERPIIAGAPLTLSLSSEQAGFGQLYSLQASGSTMALARNLPVPARTAVTFPSRDSGFTLKTRPPAGIDRIVFIVSREPLPDPVAGGPPTAATSRPVAVGLSQPEFVGRLGAALAQLHPDSWSSSILPLEIMVRK